MVAFFLAEEFLYCSMLFYCLVNFWRIALLVNTGKNHFFLGSIVAHPFLYGLDGFKSHWPRDTPAKTANACKNVYCRIVLVLGKASVKHYVAVQSSAYLVGDWLVHVVTVNKNRVKGCNAALCICSSAFKKLWKHVEYARRIAALGWRFACCKTNFPLGMGKTGYAVKHEHNILALVTEIFGNGCGNVSRPKTGN